MEAIDTSLQTCKCGQENILQIHMSSDNRIAGFFNLEYLLICRKYASYFLHVDISESYSLVKVFKVDNDHHGCVCGYVWVYRCGCGKYQKLQFWVEGLSLDACIQKSVRAANE